jgi:glycoside/pentoside/hexuronide:cation symporter, GPH family
MTATTTFDSSHGEALRRRTLIAFTLPTLVLGIMHGPEGQIQAIYAKYAGIALTTLSAATLLSRMFDAITYPLIGYLSDLSYARRGTRKDWVAAGTVVSVIGLWQLLRPPQDVGGMYFGAWMGMTYLGWKMMEIPLQGWSYGLSEDYAQRARVQGWRGMAGVVGALMFFLMPLLAMQLGYSDSTEIDFRSLGVSAVFCTVALPLATLAAVIVVHDGVAEPPPMKRHGVGDMLRAVRGNGPLQRLLVAFIICGALGGILTGVFFLYADSYLHLGKQVAGLGAVGLLSTIAGIPFWTAMAQRYERHRVWAVSLIGASIACTAFALLTPGPLALPLCFLLYPLILFMVGGSLVAAVMMADVVDYGRLLTGEDHAGLYGSLLAFMSKSMVGVFAAVGLAIVGLFGFDAAAATQSANATFGIKLAAAVLPALGFLIAATTIWTYPLNWQRIAAVQAELAERAQRDTPNQ